MPSCTGGTSGSSRYQVEVRLGVDLVYEEKPVAILDRKERETRNRVVKFYKVLWSNHGEEDATWETEDYLKEVYKPSSKISKLSNLGTRFL